MKTEMTEREETAGQDRGLQNRTGDCRTEQGTAKQDSGLQNRTGQETTEQDRRLQNKTGQKAAGQNIVLVFRCIGILRRILIEVSSSISSMTFPI